MSHPEGPPGEDLGNAEVVLSESAQRYQSSRAITSSGENDPLELTIFVSSYNEEACIVNTLNTVVTAMRKIGRTYEIIVIDDCSKDSSVELVKSFIAQHPELNIILRVNTTNKGLARNFFEGAFFGRGEWYRLVCGDDVEPVETLVTIFRHIGEAEMVVPFQVEVKGKTFSRVFLSRAFTFAVNLISGYKMKYYNGLAVHRRCNVRRWHISRRGFGFQADLITRLLDEGVSFVEVPVKTHERYFGKSSALAPKNLLSVCHTLIDLLIRRIGKIFKVTHLRSRKANSDDTEIEKSA